MAYTIEYKPVFFIAGMTYAFFWWALFALYCIAYQLNRLRIYYVRKSRLNGKDDNVVTDLPGTQWFHRLDYVVRIPYVTGMMPLKHVIGVSLFVIINMLFILFSPFKFEMPYYLAPVGIFDRRAAFVAMVNWGFVFFLAQRNSLLPKMSGLTFEELIPFHRIIARVGLAEFIPHFVWRMIHGYDRRHVAMDALFADIEYTTGTIAMLAFLIMFATSIEVVRRRFFEVFYWCHIIGLIVAIIFTCWHETTCFAFFIPAIVLWFADRVIRSYQSWCIKTTSVRVDQVVDPSNTQEGIVRVLFESSAVKAFRPGQYVFVSIAKEKFKLWKYANWHPYTISEVFRMHDSSNNDSGIEERIVSGNNEGNEKSEKQQGSGSLTNVSSLSDTASLRRRANALPSEQAQTIASFHIKGLGNKTRKLLEASDVSSMLSVKVDGVYGPQLNYQDYQVVSLFATGIGLTPALAIMKDIVEKRASGVKTVAVENVYLTWAVRSTEEIGAFMDMFSHWLERSQKAILPVYIHVNVYVTRMATGPDVFENMPGFSLFYGERPKVSVEMDKIATVSGKRRVWAHACGGDMFTRTVINEAVKHHFVVHNETFEF
ncbi:ferric reductase like transmembrane component-domain-containing protein [Blakeslea trispora]|nr:ferric reductase like transmembrane component-domain-containing protein [Blakeslea trispora]